MVITSGARPLGGAATRATQVDPGRIRGRALTAAALLALSAVTSGATAGIAAVHRRTALTVAADAGPSAPWIASDAWLVQQLLAGGVRLLLTIATGVAVMAWLHRGHTNLRPLGRPVSRSSGWTVAAWLVPFVSLVLPPVIVKEVHDGSLLPRAPGVPDRYVSRPPVGWWWAAFLVWQVGGTSSALSVPADAASARVAAEVQLLVELAGVLAAVLACRVVLQTTRRQQELAASRGVDLGPYVGKPGPVPLLSVVVAAGIGAMLTAMVVAPGALAG